MLEVRHLGVAQKGKALLHDINIKVKANDVLCIVGASGAGKSTLLKAIVGIFPFHCGTVLLNNEPLAPIRTAFREQARHLQLVMQDPLAALNPHMRLKSSIEEPLKAFGMSSEQIAPVLEETLEHLQLLPQQINRFPHEISLGQAQRVCLARALMLRPKMILFDEPLSALDALVQKQTASLMMKVKKEFGLTYLIVTHDLGFTQAFADHVALLQGGELIEFQDTPTFFAAPRSDYAQRFIQSAKTLGGLS